MQEFDILGLQTHLLYWLDITLDLKVQALGIPKQSFQALWSVFYSEEIWEPQKKKSKQFFLSRDFKKKTPNPANQPTPIHNYFSFNF